MALRLTVSKSLAMFVYETEEMTATFTISQDDDEATIMAKLGKLNAFIQREQPSELVATNAPGWTERLSAAADTYKAAVDRASPAPVFTGRPPVTPPSFEASVAHAVSNGWELIQPGDE